MKHIIVTGLKKAGKSLVVRMLKNGGYDGLVEELPLRKAVREAIKRPPQQVAVIVAERYLEDILKETFGALPHYGLRKVRRGRLLDAVDETKATLREAGVKVATIDYSLTLLDRESTAVYLKRWLGEESLDLGEMVKVVEPERWQSRGMLDYR